MIISNNLKKTLLLLSMAGALHSEELSVITVNANEENNDSTEIASEKFTKEKIENTVQGNGFISSLLESNPNIDVTDISKNSTTAGEITPGKISIQNAPFYQNNISIDGVSNSSLIDPVLSNPYSYYDVPGNENETFVDLDLIRELNVYDSNISAEYGDFTGGVIEAKTIRPKTKKSFKISYKHTGDKFTKFHVSNPENFNQAKGDNNQPKFEKKFYNVSFSTPIGDSNGLVFSYSRKDSTIPSAYFDSFKNKTRLNENYLLKGSHYFEDDSVLDLKVTHSPNESTYFQRTVKNSDTTIKGGGSSVVANYEKSFDFWNLDSKIAYKRSENSRESSNEFKPWLHIGSKDWGEVTESGDSDFSLEGGYGNVTKEQNTIAYSFKLKSNKFETGDLTQKLNLGFDISNTFANYNRASNTYVYSNPKERNVICNGNTNDCEDNVQFFQERRVYEQEDLDVKMLKTSLYAEDTIKYKNFELKPGLRLDYNNYLKNTDIAYRLNSTYKPFNNNNTILYFGANRYYGKSFLGHKLREARIPYYDEYRSTNGGVIQNWGTSADKDTNKYVFSDLDTPYTDEKSIGLKQKISDFTFNIKYVKREAKNKFMKKYGEYKAFTNPNGSISYYKPATFTNDGYSNSEKTSFNLSYNKPTQFKYFDLKYRLTTSLFDKYKANSITYDSVSEEENDGINVVYYNGGFTDINNVKQPEKPKKINLGIDMYIKSFNVFGKSVKTVVNNSIKYTSSYNKAESTDEYKLYEEKLPNGEIKNHNVKVYQDYSFKDQINYDLKARFNIKLQKKQSLVLSTEITNVFNKVQNINSSKNRFKTGRQFWFNLAYKF